jgi:hypothetical protein
MIRGAARCSRSLIGWRSSVSGVENRRQGHASTGLGGFGTFRLRAGAGLYVREPFGFVAALRCFFRRPDIKRAADAVFANKIVLADQFFVGERSCARLRVSARGSDPVDM